MFNLLAISIFSSLYIAFIGLLQNEYFDCTICYRWGIKAFVITFFVYIDVFNTP